MNFLIQVYLLALVTISSLYDVFTRVYKHNLSASKMFFIFYLTLLCAQFLFCLGFSIDTSKEDQSVKSVSHEQYDFLLKYIVDERNTRRNEIDDLRKRLESLKNNTDDGMVVCDYRGEFMNI